MRVGFEETNTIGTYGIEVFFIYCCDDGVTFTMETKT